MSIFEDLRECWSEDLRGSSRKSRALGMTILRSEVYENFGLLIVRLLTEIEARDEKSG